ncbi:MAG: septum formation initiator family protein [Candidatus Omnitrophica bacterium]|nr:septum formation initiator family protein [Candidatus Omnitrophota bacterium]
MLKNALSLFIITIIIVVVFLPSYSKMQELKQKNQDFLLRIQYLEAKNKKLEQEGRFLKNNPEYLEKVAREKMGLIRQGEMVYKIVPQDQKPN